MKRTWLILLGLLLLAAPAVMQAQYAYTNADGSIYDYNTNADGVSLTITGYTGPPWSIVIPTNINGLTVTNIGDSAFISLENLNNVTIPNSVTNIGNHAFAQDQNLTHITILGISNGVSSIGIGAFAQTGLTSLTLPSSVTNIGSAAFGSCYQLTNLTISSGVENIANGAFEFCTSLASVTIPASVSNISFEEFAYCSGLTNIAIANGITNIGEDAFSLCTNLANVTIPASVISIQEEAFAGCDRMTNMFFMGNPPSMGNNPFGGRAPSHEVYCFYLPSASGWGPTLGGTPTRLWNPLIQTTDGGFGISNNQFGFNITGTTNIPIVLEACTDLANPLWIPLQSITLSNGSFYFSEPLQTNSSSRFYRISSP